MKVCLADTSSLILLNKCDLIPILNNVYTVVITPSVYEELTVTSHDDEAFFKKQAEFFTVKTPPPYNDRELNKLDHGERDLIILYLSFYSNKSHSFILTDDGRASRLCNRKDIHHTNALMINRILFESQIISREQYQTYREKLLTIGWYSEYVTDYEKKSIRQDLLYFLPDSFKSLP